MKTRLYQEDRNAICLAILRHKFDPIEAASKTEENGLAEEVRIRACGEFLKTMAKAPVGAFPTSSSVRIAVDGRSYTLNFGGEYPNKLTPRLFYSHYNHRALQLPIGDELGDRVSAWAERREATKKDREQLSNQTAATLSSFRSFDALLEAWPEAERFVTTQWRGRSPAGPRTLPAVQFAKLTEALGLPPGDDPVSVAA